MATAAASSSGQKISPQQMNALARQAVLSSSVRMFQPVATGTIVPANNPVLNIQPRYVGLLRGFLVTVTGTIVNADADNALTLTDLGLSNIFAPVGGVVFTDLNNNQRVNTGGYHLSAINSIKHRKPYGAGWACETDLMMAFGETFGVVTAPATIAAASSASFRATFYVPVAYTPNDLRGAIYMNVINASAQLTLNFNTAAQMFVATGVDSTFAMYKGTANASISTLTYNVYQDYLDQLPQGPNGVVLPALDLSTVYELKTTQVPNITAGQDNPVQYANFRSFLSTFFIYDNNPANDSGRTAGTDLNYIALQVANYTNLWKMDPLTLSQMTRDILGTDFPKGCYYINSRSHPIETTQYGNQEFVLNPSVANAGALAYVGYEDFANVNVVTSAGSLV